MSTPSTDGSPALPDVISCNALYRPQATTAGGEETAVLSVTRRDDLRGDEAAATFETMILRINYVGEAPEGRTVSLQVEAGNGEPLATTLCQIGDEDLSEIAFSGGHGFTGLHYVEHNGSQLQFWCTASP